MSDLASQPERPAPAGVPPGAQQPAPYPPAPYPPAPFYAQPAHRPAPGNGQAIAALVLGSSGLALLLTTLGLAFFLSLPCAVMGWIFGVKARGRVERGETIQHAGIAQAGIVTGIIGVVLGVLALAFWVLVLIAAGTTDEY